MEPGDDQRSRQDEARADLGLARSCNLGLPRLLSPSQRTKSHVTASQFKRSQHHPDEEKRAEKV